MSKDSSLNSIDIRLFQKQDAEQIAKLFHQTVREVNINDYSINQVKAWAPDDINFRNLNNNQDIVNNRVWKIKSMSKTERNVLKLLQSVSYKDIEKLGFRQILNSLI